MAQRLMWSFFVVLPQPLLGLLSDFIQALKHVHVEHRFTVAAIESFNEAVLHRFAWLDELKRHAMIFGPVSQRDGDQLWSVVPSKVGVMLSPSWRMVILLKEH